MKKFKFTLEALLTVRQRQEQEAQEQYAKALLARRQAIERLDAVQLQLNAGWQELRELLARGCEALKAAQMQNYHRTLETRRNECLNTLGLAERRVNAALNAMLAARRQREVVDNCFDKQKARHQREHQLEEQKFLDELGSRRLASIFAWNPTGALS